jgi:hypothetical protein
LLGEYQYDGNHHRIVKFIPASWDRWDRTDFYENGDWQDLEERFLSGTQSKTIVATEVSAQQVYDLRYIDAVMVRNGYFYCHNDLFSVQALVTGGGTVVERYEYDPYGDVTVLDAGGTSLHRTRLDHRRVLGWPWQRMGGRGPALRHDRCVGLSGRTHS